MEAELREYGLSEKEAKIYLTSLKLGPSTANAISAKADLRRSTTYDIIESLKSKGLISSFQRDGKHFFQAAEPTELLGLLHHKEDVIQKIIPQLEALKVTAAEKPKVHLFEGVKGITTMLEPLYQEKELLIYGSARKASEMLRHIPQALAYRRAELGIKAKMIFERGDFAEFRLKEPKIRRVTSMKFLESMKHYPSVTWIGGNQVGIVTLEKEIIGIHIINSEIAKTQQLVFRSLWESANG